MQQDGDLVSNIDFFEKWLSKSLENSLLHTFEFNSQENEKLNSFFGKKIIIVENEENPNKENNFIRKFLEKDSNILNVRKSDFSSNDNYILEEIMNADIVFWDGIFKNSIFTNLANFIKSNRKIKFYYINNLYILKNFISDIVYLSKIKNLSYFSSEKLKDFLSNNFNIQIKISGNRTVLYNLSKILNVKIEDMGVSLNYKSDENNKTNIIYYDFSDMSYSPYIMNKVQKLKKIRDYMHKEEIYFRTFNTNIKDIMNSGIYNSNFFLNTNAVQECNNVTRTFFHVLSDI